MKMNKHRIVAAVIALCMLMGVFTVQYPETVLADSTDIYQVNGKFTISESKLITKCRLETADNSLKKKTRVYKITSKTKIQTVNDSNYSKKTLKGNQRKKMIKKLNKKNQTIQFKEKNGVVTLIWII